jgi:hypothetical protein
MLAQSGHHPIHSRGGYFNGAGPERILLDADASPFHDSPLVVYVY